MAKDDPPALEVVTEFVRKADTLDETVYLGIDPGADGAIGLLCGRLYAVVDIPTFLVGRTRSKKLSAEETARTGKKTKTSKGTKTLFDHQGILELFRAMRPIKDRICVCLEEAQVQVKGKGCNAYSGYRVGVGYAIWPLYLASRGWPVEEVTPGVWKQRMGLQGVKGEPSAQAKERSRRKALGMFPKASLKLKQDHNRAEAMLLAEYLRREREGTGRKRRK
jgi:hypothetical protein